MVVLLPTVFLSELTIRQFCPLGADAAGPNPQIQKMTDMAASCDSPGECCRTHLGAVEPLPAAGHCPCLGSVRMSVFPQTLHS
jgi:hypothetical protein